MKNTSRKKFRLTKKVFSVPYILFLLLFVVTPLVLILVNAFLDSDGSLTLENFKTFFTSKSSLVVLGNSLLVGVITTVLCLVLGYPVAYFLSKMSSGRILVLLYVIPMGVNFLIRTLATKAIFIALGIELGMGTVLFGMVYNYLPFMILPLHTTISSIDKSYIEAAQDLGADKATVFLKTTLPLSMSGIFSGITMVFLPSMTNYVVLDMLYNSTYIMGSLIGSYFAAYNWNGGSMIALILLLIILVFTLITDRYTDEGTSRGGALL